MYRGLPFVSVCIPAYEMGGDGSLYLDEALKSIAGQTFQDIEVVVTDQSKDGAVASVCRRWESKLQINYVNTKHVSRRASVNCNAAMRLARGQVLKILFQDDFFLANEALADIADSFKSSDAAWLLCGSGQTRDGKNLEQTMAPSLHPYILFGKNTVSSPSALAMTKDCACMFDENLVWLMDVEIYYRLLRTHGSPLILPQALVANREHPQQVSASVSKELCRRELDYVRSKHRSSEGLLGKFAYYKRLRKYR